MKIISLVENTSSSSEYRSEHGLCLYIETSKHKILFDLGQDKLFAENAAKMNIDISDIDTVIISHGHRDHGGGLNKFLELNTKAKIYIRKEAFEPHYVKVLNIPFSAGLDRGLADCSRLVFTDKKIVIDDELILFSDVKTDKYFSKSNKVLFAKKQGRLISDNFNHEQNLVIVEGTEKVLISGCSHSGIVNIQNRAEQIVSDRISVVAGGFHLYNPPTRKYESNEFIDSVATVLKNNGSIYYTCHCTGIKAYKRMKSTLGDRLKYLSVGTEVILK